MKPHGQTWTRQVTIKQAVEPDGWFTALVVDERGDYLIESRRHSTWGAALVEAANLAKVFGLQVVRFGGDR